MKTRILVSTIVILAVAAGGLWWWRSQATAASADSGLEATGVIEARELTVAPETGGQIVEVLVEESDAVEAGEPLFRLDDETLQIQRRQIVASGKATQAALELELISAQRALDDLHEDSPLIFAQAQLELAIARDELHEMEKKWRNQQEGYRGSISTVRAAEAELALAKEAMEDAERNADKFSSDDPEHAQDYKDYAAAVQRYRLALSSLNWYTGHPTEIDQGLLDAEVAIAEARVEQAKLEWEKWKTGPDPDALAIAEARLANAEAQLEAAHAQLEAELEMADLELDKYVVRAPAAGVVITSDVEPNELILAGAQAMTIGRLDRLELTVYLPEDRFGWITPGQEARITVDAYPDSVFTGTVLRVADEAEFTPTNIQTKEERIRLVYAVVIDLDNPGLMLKPGMIADAAFMK